MADDPQLRKRPGPFAQDLSRQPPSKQQRDKDYLPEKKETGRAIKKKPTKPNDTRLRG
jgi:hypothetical protein